VHGQSQPPLNARAERLQQRRVNPNPYGKEEHHDQSVVLRPRRDDPLGMTCQASDPVTVVTAFNAAVSAQHLTGALALLDDTFLYVSAPCSALPTNLKKGEFPGQPPFQQVDQSNIHLIDATTVEMDLTFSGETIPVLLHPFVLHATFTVKNGLITRLQDRLSPQTAQDLAALAPPPGAVAQDRRGRFTCYDMAARARCRVRSRRCAGSEILVNLPVRNVPSVQCRAYCFLRPMHTRG
jgi:hypothetical protein